ERVRGSGCRRSPGRRRSPIPGARWHRRREPTRNVVAKEQASTRPWSFLRAPSCAGAQVVASDAVEELQHALGEQRRCLGVVRGEGAVREVVLVAGVQEELRLSDLLDDLAGGVDVALAGEDRV